MISTVLIISVLVILAALLVDHRAPLLRSLRRRKRHLARRVVPGHTEAYEPLDQVVARRNEHSPARSLRRALRRLRRRGRWTPPSS